jgi:adhesin/invasin
MLTRSSLLVVLLAATIACDKVPLTAPSSATITVTSSTKSVALSGSVVITAALIESTGSPVQNGTTVRFTTTLGRVEPAEAQTTNGIATTTLMAGEASGVAQVRAISGAAAGSTAGADAIEIQIGGASATTIALAAPVSTLPAAGGTAAVTATVTDAGGARVRGALVRFSTTAGTLSTASATSDANGEATVQLTTTLTATVTATLGTAASAPTATVLITVVGANSVALTTAPAAPFVGQPVTLTVTPTIGANNIPSRVVINWGDGSAEQDLGIVATVRAVAHTFTRSGAFTITATATGSNGTATTSTAVTVAPSRPSVALTVAPATTTVGQSVSLTVTPTIPASNTAPRVVVEWGDGRSDDLGAVPSARTVAHVYGGAGTFTIVATATGDGETSNTSTTVVITPRPALGVTMTATPAATTSISVGNTTQFTATVTPAVGGADMVESYTWEFGDGARVTTSGNSTSHVYDESPNPATARVASVTVRTTDGRSASTQVEFITPGATVP